MKTQVKLTLSIDEDKLAFVQQLLKELACVEVEVWEVEASSQNFYVPQEDDLSVWDYVAKEAHTMRKNSGDARMEKVFTYLETTK